VPFILLIGSTALRNYLVAKDPVFITAHSGINFYIGNNHSANGLFKVPPYMRPTQAGLLEDARIIAQSVEGRRLKASEVSRFWFRRSLKFIRKYPRDYLRLLGRKLFLFWNAKEYVDDIEYYLFDKEAALSKFPLLHFSFIGPLALLGLFLALPKGKQVALIYVFIISLMLATISFFINSRYRLICLPYLIILASFSLYRMFEMGKKKQYRGLAICITLAIGLYFPININLVKSNSYLDYTLHYNKGIYLFDQKDYTNAEEEFRAALAINPLDYMSYLGLGNVYYQKQEFPEAINNYKKALEINPYFYKAYFNIGFIYYEKEDYRRAEEEFRKVLTVNPDDCAAYYNLGRVYQKQGLYDKALIEYEQALRVKPKHPEVVESIEEIKELKAR